MNSTNGNAAFDARMIDDIVADLAGKPGTLMLVLHAVNDRVGYIPVEAVPAIARAIESFARRGPRSHQLLSRFSHRAPRPENHPRMPRRVVPGDGRSRARDAHSRSASELISDRPAATAISRSSRFTVSATAHARRQLSSATISTAASLQPVSTKSFFQNLVRGDLDDRGIINTSQTAARRTTDASRNSRQEQS